MYDYGGTKLISYAYDAWGNFVTEGSGTSTTAALNPFRYRSYYYDIDLGLYYLNSRYYDPNTGRFISADSALYHSMLGYNMYAYCENNPVNYVDYTGENFTSALGWWTTVIGPASMAEPTVFGEILLGAGTIILGTGALLEGAIETIETAKTIIDIALAEKAEDPPKKAICPPKAILIPISIYTMEKV